MPQIPHGAGENKIFIESSLTKTGLYVEIPSPTLPRICRQYLSLALGPYWLLHVFAPPWGSPKPLATQHLMLVHLGLHFGQNTKVSSESTQLVCASFVITIPVSIVMPLLLSLPLLLTHLIPTKNLAMRISRLVTFGAFSLIAAGMLIYAILEAPEPRHNGWSIGMGKLTAAQETYKPPSLPVATNGLERTGLVLGCICVASSGNKVGGCKPAYGIY